MAATAALYTIMAVLLVIKSLLLATCKDDNDWLHTFMPQVFSILSLSISAVNTLKFYNRWVRTKSRYWNI